jgi:hypothetical protein
MSFLTPSAPYEKSKFLGSGESMVARLKLKGIDGEAHQEWSLRLKVILGRDSQVYLNYSLNGKMHLGV